LRIAECVGAHFPCHDDAAQGTLKDFFLPVEQLVILRDSDGCRKTEESLPIERFCSVQSIRNSCRDLLCAAQDDSTAKGIA